MINTIGNFIIALGALFCLISVLGLSKFSDVFSKMHAATKTSTLGCGLVLIGTAFHIDGSHSLTELILLVFFISLTNPISAHMIANLIYRKQSKAKSNH